MTTVKCPTCGTLVTWQPENTYRPFCSQRCKLIDLGEWASEQRAIVAQPTTPEEWDELLHQVQQHHD